MTESSALRAPTSAHYAPALENITLVITVVSGVGMTTKWLDIVTALNPKGIIFFMAFFPLFLDINKSVLSQMLTMAVSFIFVSGMSVSFYSIFSGLLRSKVKSIKFQKVFSKMSGSMLMGAGAVTASPQKSG